MMRMRKATMLFVVLTACPEEQAPPPGLFEPCPFQESEVEPCAAPWICSLDRICSFPCEHSEECPGQPDSQSSCSSLSLGGRCIYSCDPGECPPGLTCTDLGRCTVPDNPYAP